MIKVVIARLLIRPSIGRYISLDLFQNSPVITQVKLIEHHYKSQQGTDRQMIGKIMKTDHPDRLIKLYKELIKRPKVNYTYIAFILARMIEYENSRLNYTNKISDDMVSLTSKMLFYQLLHNFEANLHRLKPADMAYVLYSLSHTKRLNIRFDLLISRILEITLHEENYELLENDLKVKMYLSCVLIIKRKLYDVDEVMTTFIEKSADNMITVLKDKDTNAETLFKICKAHYKMRYKNISRIENLNKLLIKQKNAAKPKDYYNWYMLNAIQDAETDTLYVILKEIVNNKNILKCFNFKMIVNCLYTIETKTFEGRAIMKRMIKNELLNSICVILQQDIQMKRKNPHIKSLIDYLNEYNTDTTKLITVLLEFYKANLFVDSQIHDTFLFLYNKKAISTPILFTQLDEAKDVKFLQFDVLNKILDILKQNEYNPHNTIKKKIKLFVKRLKKNQNLSHIDTIVDELYPVFVEDMKYFIYFKNILKINLLNDNILNSERIEDACVTSEITEIQNDIIEMIVRSNHKLINILYTLSKIYNNVKRDALDTTWRNHMGITMNMVKIRFHPKYLSDQDINFLLTINDRTNDAEIKHIVQEALDVVMKDN